MEIPEAATRAQVWLRAEDGQDIAQDSCAVSSLVNGEEVTISGHSVVICEDEASSGATAGCSALAASGENAVRPPVKKFVAKNAPQQALPQPRVPLSSHRLAHQPHDMPRAAQMPDDVVHSRAHSHRPNAPAAGEQPQLDSTCYAVSQPSAMPFRPATVHAPMHQRRSAAETLALFLNGAPPCSTAPPVTCAAPGISLTETSDKCLDGACACEQSDACSAVHTASLLPSAPRSQLADLQATTHLAVPSRAFVAPRPAHAQQGALRASDGKDGGSRLLANDGTVSDMNSSVGTNCGGPGSGSNGRVVCRPASSLSAKTSAQAPRGPLLFPTVTEARGGLLAPMPPPPPLALAYESLSSYQAAMSGAGAWAYPESESCAPLPPLLARADL